MSIILSPAAEPTRHLSTRSSGCVEQRILDNPNRDSVAHCVKCHERVECNNQPERNREQKQNSQGIGPRLGFPKNAMAPTTYDTAIPIIAIAVLKQVRCVCLLSLVESSQCSDAIIPSIDRMVAVGSTSVASFSKPRTCRDHSSDVSRGYSTRGKCHRAFRP